MTAVVLRQQFVPTALAPMKNLAPVSVSNWDRLISTGHHSGPRDASVVVLQFGDFECPYCQKFSTRILPGVLAGFPGQVAVVFRHWPLPYHRFAYPAARAAECAGEQGQFQPFSELLYMKQDSLGLKPFDDYAREAGVTDRAAFQLCNSRPGRVASIEADMEAAIAAGASGTPTVLVNGLRYPEPPDSAGLAKAIRNALTKAAGSALR